MRGSHKTINAEIVQETDKAYCVEFSSDDEPVWIPKSVILDPDTLSIGDTELDVERWWLQKNGIN